MHRKSCLIPILTLWDVQLSVSLPFGFCLFKHFLVLHVRDNFIYLDFLLFKLHICLTNRCVALNMAHYMLISHHSVYICVVHMLDFIINQ